MNSLFPKKFKKRCKANRDYRERERQKTAPLELVYDTDEILRKRLFVAKPMTLTRSTKLLDEIDDLDDVIHDLFPHLSIKVDFLKQNVTVNPAISLSLAKVKKKTYALDPDDLHKDVRDGS